MAAILRRIRDWLLASIRGDVEQMEARIEALERQLTFVRGLLTEDQVGLYATVLGGAKLDRAILLIDESGTALFTEHNPGQVTNATND